MRDHIDIINEYVIDNSFTFTMPSFDRPETTIVGSLITTKGNFEIARIDLSDLGTVAFAAVKSATDLVNPVGYVGFLKAGETLIGKNAYVPPEYQGAGLSKKLFLFAADYENKPIISDTIMSDSGEGSLKATMSSGEFHVRVFYIPTREIFQEKQIGEKTSDNETVISPADDNRNRSMWSETNPNGQKFFWLLLRNLSMIGE